MTRARAKSQGRARDQCKGNTMRLAAGLIFAGVVSLCASGTAWSQTPAARGVTAPPVPAAALAPAKAPCANPNALGIARVVEIDTTGGPGFGFEHFKQLDFLRGNPEAGRRGGSYHRDSYMVARDPDQQETDRTAAQGGD